MAAAKWFHFTPFKHIWKSPVTGQEQRLYDELYTSDAWNKAHDDMQKQRRDDGCNLEHVIAGLMFWSDGTQLAQFGHAKAWPVYLFFGNLSKYRRASVSGACHPIAFIPPVSFYTIFAQYTLINITGTSCRNRSPLSSVTSRRLRTAIYLHTANVNLSMQFGRSYWTTSSLKPTETEWLSGVMMEYFAVFTPESLPILQIILRSEYTHIYVFTS